MSKIRKKMFAVKLVNDTFINFFPPIFHSTLPLFIEDLLIVLSY